MSMIETYIPLLHSNKYRHTVTTGFNAYESDVFLLNELIKCANGIAAATTDARNNDIRKLPHAFYELLLDLTPDNMLEVSDNSGEWVWANCRTNEIVCHSEVRHPISRHFVNCVFQGF